MCVGNEAEAGNFMHNTVKVKKLAEGIITPSNRPRKIKSSEDSEPFGFDQGRRNVINNYSGKAPWVSSTGELKVAFLISNAISMQNLERLIIFEL
jgi:hypothetical protein